MPLSVSSLSSGIKEMFGKFKRRPSADQSLKFFSVLNPREKKTFLGLALTALLSFAFLSVNFYFSRTREIPSAGGKFIEGAVGEPRFINPVLAPARDTDRDLTELLFAGLMKYTAKGAIVNDLADSYQIKENGKVWEITLKKDLTFQDGTPLTADDVIFTVKLIQNADYKSPLRASWLGVETERISDLSVRFKLKNPFPGFLENLTLKILPKNIWENVPAENFALDNFNLRPVGSGPYKVDKIGRSDSGAITSMDLGLNPRYAGKAPKIAQISFVFFENEEELVKAAQKKQIDGFVLTLPKDLEGLEKKYQLRLFQLPQYFSVFLNPQNQVLSDQKVRQALNYGLDRQELIDSVIGGQAEIVSSPLLPEIFGLSQPENAFGFDPGKANELLENAGFVLNPQTGFREKNVQKKLAFEFKGTLSKGSQGTEVRELQKCLSRFAEIYPGGEVTGSFGDKTKQAVILFQEKYRQEVLEPSGLTQGNGEMGVLTRKKLNDVCFGPKEQLQELKFSLVTVDDPVLLEVAENLKNQWKKLGVNLEIKSYVFFKLNTDYIKPRSYDALLFGEVLGQTLDPLPFWHSLQKRDPGLNLALFDNKNADALLEASRQTFDPEQKKEKLEEFQKILLNASPAVFLYRPYFLYLTADKIKGIETGFITDPSKRFSQINDWYIKTKRVWEK